MESPGAATERQAVARLCASLPELRELAERGSWSEDLAWSVGEVADGGSALAVCRQFGLLDGEPADGGDADLAHRGAESPGSAGGQLVGLAEVTLTGGYRCPTGRCVRRAQRDDLGRPPFCALAGAPMAFRSVP